MNHFIDNGGRNIKKIFGIFLATMLIIPVLSVTGNNIEKPELEIGKIKGYSTIRSMIRRSVLVDIEILNNGEIDVENINSNN